MGAWRQSVRGNLSEARAHGECPLRPPTHIYTFFTHTHTFILIRQTGQCRRRCRVADVPAPPVSLTNQFSSLTPSPISSHHPRLLTFADCKGQTTRQDRRLPPPRHALRKFRRYPSRGESAGCRARASRNIQASSSGSRCDHTRVSSYAIHTTRCRPPNAISTLFFSTPFQRPMIAIPTPILAVVRLILFLSTPF